jgi:lipid-A-disaccharide synthase
MLQAAAIVHQKHPETRFLIASFSEKQAEIARHLIVGMNMPVQVHVGRTLDIIDLAEACISVSGSVSLEIMYQLKPAVVVYRVSKVGLRLGRFFMKCKFITLVNLLADKEIFPEFLTDRNPSAGVAARVLDLLDDPQRAEQVREDLQEVRDRVAKPGACERAAKFLMEQLEMKAPLPLAA